MKKLYRNLLNFLGYHFHELFPITDTQKGLIRKYVQQIREASALIDKALDTMKTKASLKNQAQVIVETAIQNRRIRATLDSLKRKGM
jgi:hypothetical protein